MSDRSAFELALLVALVLPLFGAATIGPIMLKEGPAAERWVVRISAVCLSGSFLASACAAMTAVAQDALQHRVDLGEWFRAGEYAFHLGLIVDVPSLVLMLLVAAITGLVGRFSVSYLHREPGFARFFLLLHLFSFGMLTLVTSASVDQLFVGWELVGLTSALLVGFFHLRRTPVDAGLRVFTTYRLCDIGLLFGAVLLHRFSGTSEFILPANAGIGGHGSLTSGQATLVALCFLLGAIGKSAQFPVGGWLPRAMEGPTPSSALFYGALSIHAGVYLLIRSAPLLSQSTVAATAVIVIGAVTALHAGWVVRTQSDAKNALAYATMAQVGLMFVEVGAGFYRLALWHLVAHACLRTFQFLRAPSALRDAHLLHAALGHHPHGTAPGWLPDGWHVWAYRLGIERFHLDTIQLRWFVLPLLALGGAIDRLERKWTEWLLARKNHQPSTAAAESAGSSGRARSGDAHNMSNITRSSSLRASPNLQHSRPPRYEVGDFPGLGRPPATVVDAVFATEGRSSMMPRRD